MARKSLSRDTRLIVAMNGVLVGRLERKSSGALRFAYEPGWLERESAIPLSRRLPLREAAYQGDSVRSYFDNLLPDDPRVRERLAARAQARGTQSFDLLAAVGRDCVGALQFFAEGAEPPPISVASGSEVTEAQIAEILRGLRLNPLGIDPERDFRISLAGVQSKTALLRMNDRWLLPEGATPTTHILKPAIGSAVENEWLCLRILRAYGFEVAKAEVHEFEGIRVLTVERFDRRWSGKKLYRIPQEDLCQALGVGPEMKYEAEGGPGIARIVGLLAESDDAERDRRTFLKAQVVFWLMAAIDGHAKNFSVFLGPGGSFSLTPLYDVMSADPHVHPRALPEQKLKLAMAIGTNRHYRVREILPRHFLQTAAQLRFHGMQALLNEVAQQTPQVLDQVHRELPPGFPDRVAGPILEKLRERSRKLTG